MAGGLFRRSPATLRRVSALTTTPARPSRPFTTTRPTPAGSPLFALAALSNSRESQHFRKITRLSQIEHSTPLQFIRSSEGLDPHHRPPTRTATPGVTASARSSKRRAHAAAASVSLSSVDANALSVGRTLIANHAARVGRLTRRIKQMGVVRERESRAWSAQKGKLEGEHRTAIVLMLAAIGAATAVALWRFGEAAKPRTRLVKMEESPQVSLGEEVRALDMSSLLAVVPERAPVALSETAANSTGPELILTGGPNDQLRHQDAVLRDDKTPDKVGKSWSWFWSS